MEEILARQKDEKKELIKKVQSLKHSAPKGDKKKKKEVGEMISKLENELETRHFEELKIFNEAGNKSEGLETDMCSLAIGDKRNDKERVSKAEKRRQKKELKAKEINEIYEQAEIDYEFSKRKIELDKINGKLAQRNLSLFEIPSDGNCMFVAIEHQLKLLGLEGLCKDLRRTVAASLRINKDLYQLFLSDEHSGEPLSDEGYEIYCDKMENTPAWGGQLELKILSETLKKKICVIQAEGPDVVLGEEYQGPELVIAFHRHVYELGEHYNSTAEKIDREKQED